MQAADIREYIVSRAAWVNPKKTVDTFKHGDPRSEVRSAAVTWMLTMEAIDEAERLGVDLVVTHEPTFYSHWDEIAPVKDDPIYKAKRRRLDEAGLTVLRIHDSWDSWPGIGVGASLAKLLGLTEAASRARCFKAYRLKSPKRLDRFADFVRRKLRMDAVGVMGDGARKVRRVGLSFGALGGIDAMRRFLDMKSDVIVAGELTNWREIRYFQDVGIPLILTDHAASENPGMRALAKFIRERFGIPAHFIETGPCLRTLMK